ncbi:hypothetical protein Q3G72_024482 [Acer saccharum]|nr:hypothetical protein Q3G72_024482 [Acer saccharum]
MEVLAKIELIDILMKLGLSILFEKEIMEALDSIAASIKINNHTLVEDLYATALCFRLLRLHGHEISQGDGSKSYYRLDNKTLTKVNGLVLAPSAASLKPFVNVLANYPRSSSLLLLSIIQDGDGFGIQEDLKSKLLSVLIEPV